MKFEKQMESVKNFFVRLGRRNLIIICAVLLIGVAAAVNVIYFAADEPVDAGTGAAGGAADAGAAESAESYFTASQISRQRARDEALEVLQNVIDNEGADSDAKAVAIADIAKMASDMEAEANVETLVMAKGFSQCVAVIGGDSINVVVDVDSTLNASQIAQINTIVFEQTGITPDKTVIIEK